MPRADQAWRRTATRALSLALGVACGVLLSFALHRFGLPVSPFIYQAF